MDTPDIFNSKSLKGFIKGSLVLIGLLFILSFGVAALLICFDKNIDANKNIEFDNNNESDNNNENDRNIKIDKKIEIGRKIDISKHIEIDNNDKIVKINNNIKTGRYFECKVFTLILLLIILPLIIFLTVFLRFSCLVKSYYKSLTFNEDEFITKEKNLIKKEKVKMIGETCITVAKAITPDYEKNGETLDKLKEMLEILSNIGSKEKSPKKAKATPVNPDDKSKKSDDCQEYVL